MAHLTGTLGVGEGVSKGVREGMCGSLSARMAYKISLRRNGQKCVTTVASHQIRHCDNRETK